jgi:2-haloalkanoic acid dehalogenase type II
MADLDPGAYDVLTFDCYGTLIDWESGILTALRTALGDAVAGAGDEELLAAFAAVEHDAETPYRPYREVLGLCLDALAERWGASVPEQARAAFGESVGDWPAFPDSGEALGRLGTRYRLMPITNCDDDLFARSAQRLGVEFDDVVTAEQAGAYKPDERPFLLAFERAGVPRERILHVAQSLFHDHVPAARLGLTSVWIDRRAGREGGGATPPAQATPALRLEDLRSLADLLIG